MGVQNVKNLVYTIRKKLLVLTSFFRSARNVFVVKKICQIIWFSFLAFIFSTGRNINISNSSSRLYFCLVSEALSLASWCGGSGCDCLWCDRLIAKTCVITARGVIPHWLKLIIYVSSLCYSSKAMNWSLLVMFPSLCHNSQAMDAVSRCFQTTLTDFRYKLYRIQNNVDIFCDQACTCMCICLNFWRY